MIEVWLWWKKSCICRVNASKRTGIEKRQVLETNSRLMDRYSKTLDVGEKCNFIDGKTV